jgi:simple sugar transport system ATP-binding protein
MDFAFEMGDISKMYPENNLKANDSVNLSLRKGEILCLAGENGAGKTTLMKILYGLEKPDSGTIKIWGKEEKIYSPLVANRLKIGMVHQHFMLVEEFTVAQNVVMGVEPIRKGFFYDQAKANKDVEKVIQDNHFSLASTTLVKDLTVGQKQQVEILKMLFRDIDILILDEPTAILAEQEIAALFKTLTEFRKKGKSLVLITHKLQEVKRISDRVAVMRQGKMVGTYETGSIDEQTLSHHMMGKDFEIRRFRCASDKEHQKILTFESVTVLRPSQEKPLLDSISFTAYSNEILGFVTVGRNEMGVLESVLGGLKHISKGKIFHREEDITNLDARQLRKKGLSYVPADRLRVGGSLTSSVKENLIVNHIEDYSCHGFLDYNRIQLDSKRLLDAYSVGGNPSRKLGTLSGGNIQKVLLAREISQEHDYLVLCEPTWGLDVASSQYVYEKITSLCDSGSAILLLSSNLDELLSLANRLIVLHQGEIVAVFEESELHVLTKVELGQYMLGLKRQVNYGT